MKHKLEKIKVIITDVDGVLTDGKLYYGANGETLKAFNVQDGMGLTLAKRAGLKIGIITGRKSEMITFRGQELKYDVVIQGQSNKLPAYEKVKQEHGWQDEEICYIGDDLPDLPLLKRVGFSVAVANARDILKAECDYTTVKAGGEGAVRETIDKILRAQNKFDALIEPYLS